MSVFELGGLTVWGARHKKPSPAVAEEITVVINDAMNRSEGHFLARARTDLEEVDKLLATPTTCFVTAPIATHQHEHEHSTVAAVIRLDLPDHDGGDAAAHFGMLGVREVGVCACARAWFCTCTCLFI